VSHDQSESVKLLKELTLTDSERNLLAGGFCPKCEKPIRGKFDPVGKAHFARPEIYETLRERNIDLDSGHLNTCELKGLRLL
jgi:hypothetical protein